MSGHPGLARKLEIWPSCSHFSRQTFRHKVRLISRYTCYIGKRSESCGRKASGPTPVTVTTGRVAGLHLVLLLAKVPPVAALPLCCMAIFQRDGDFQMRPVWFFGCVYRLTPMRVPLSQSAKITPQALADEFGFRQLRIANSKKIDGCFRNDTTCRHQWLALVESLQSHQVCPM